MVPTIETALVMVPTTETALGHCTHYWNNRMSWYPLLKQS